MARGLHLSGDEVSPAQWMLLEVQRIDGSEGGESVKAKVIGMMKHLAGQRVYFSRRDLVRPDEVQRARDLLEAGNPTQVVRDVLIAAYGCSTRHAYNLISDALNQRGKDRAAAMRRAQSDMFHP